MSTAPQRSHDEWLSRYALWTYLTTPFLLAMDGKAAGAVDVSTPTGVQAGV